jgi:hypothetical protein
MVQSDDTKKLTKKRTKSMRLATANEESKEGVISPSGVMLSEPISPLTPMSRNKKRVGMKKLNTQLTANSTS